jgi:hypothetical protein
MISSEIVIETEATRQVSQGDVGIRAGRPPLGYLGWFLGTLAVGSLVLSYSAYRAGSFTRALSFMMGQRLFVSETKIDLGEVVCGNEVEVMINLRNCGSEPISIAGMRQSCGCISLDSFPIEVEASSTHPVQIKIKVPKDQGEFTHTVEFYAVGQQLSSFQIFVSGKSIE